MREDIAIVGIGGIFPDAMDFSEYWSNIIKRKDSVKDLPEKYWALEDFYDPDPNAEDKTYAKKAATVGSIYFDPVEYGIPPKVMQSISVEQFFGLVVAKQALVDAGLIGKDAKQFDRSKTGVIIAAGIGKTAHSLHARTFAPTLFRILRNSGVPEKTAKRVIERYKNSLNDWDEASNPGYLSNVVAGRIANRFDFGGTTCAVNAACGSSLAAIKYSISELLEGNCDVMLAGGVNLDCTAHTFLAFSKTPAMSKRNECTPFDENADGMMLGDGVGMVVLKRLSDAKRDQDRIYAVIKGVGSSSDGKAKSIFSPSKEGQLRAIENAFINAKVAKDSISLIEAHGTGTNKGDVCEAEALTEIFSEDKGNGQELVIGSVKSQIGHLRMAAGIAGLIKVALALYHKNLTPTLHVKKPNAAIPNSNLYVMKKARPWIANKKNPIRRAGVSAFGFGGTNFHTILEEAESEHQDAYRLNIIPEVVAFTATSEEELKSKIKVLLDELTDDKAAWRKPEYKYPVAAENELRLAFVASDESDVEEKCELALLQLEAKKFDELKENDIYYGTGSNIKDNKVAVMFSGQGAQYVDMLSSVACAYPEMRETLKAADNIMIDQGVQPISEIIYPFVHSKDEKKQMEKELMQTSNTQIALAVVESSLYDIATSRGFDAQFMLGHSFGELTALYADGVFDKQSLLKLSLTRGTLMQESLSDCETGMLAVFMERQKIIEAIKGMKDLYIANENSDKQTIVSGSLEAINCFEKMMEEQKVKTVRLKVSCAFHSPYMQKASEQFDKALGKEKIGHSSGRVIGNVDGKCYQTTKTAVRKNLTTQIVSPVKFQSCIEKAYDEGARIFVEFGPGRVLSRLAEEILSDKEVQIVSMNPDKYEDANLQLENAFARLYVMGMPIKNDPYRRVLGPEYINKKTKSSFEVDPIIFHLDNKKKMIEEALNTVDVVEVAEQPLKAEIVMNDEIEERVEVEADMNKNVNDICKLRELNASVFEQFIKVQNEQIKCMGDLLEKCNAKAPEEKKEIFECIKTFQANSMRALEIYFDKQGSGSIPVSYQVTDVAVEEPTQVAAVEPVKVEPVKVEPVKVETPVVEVKPVVAPKEEPVQVEEEVAATAEPEQSSVNIAEVEDMVLDIVSEKTGYVKDMIEKDMELESDLGIDSINRVEIFSDINERIGEKLTAEHLEELSFIETINEIVEFIVKCLNEDN